MTTRRSYDVHKKISNTTGIKITTENRREKMRKRLQKYCKKEGGTKSKTK